MLFILSALATYAVYRMLKRFTSLPPGVLELLAPFIFWGIWLLPFLPVACLAGSAVVATLNQLILESGTNTVAQVQRMKRSKIPPIG